MALCSDPYMDNGTPRPCGRCLPCLKARAWRATSRIILESFSHDRSSFVTLTYNEENLPDQHPDTDAMCLPTVNPTHARNFIKRLRRLYSQDNTNPLKYYLIGEYGSKTWRPHYHLALFGYPACHYGQTRGEKLLKGKSCCPPCDMLQKAWSLKGKPLGKIDNGTLEPAGAAYIAGYVTSKLHNKNNGYLLGRYPQFARQSNRPALGAITVEKLAPILETEIGQDALTENGDVPICLNFGGQTLVLDRYLRQHLRKNLTMEENVNVHTGEITYKAKDEATAQQKAEMRLLYEDFLQKTLTEKISWQNYVVSLDAQKIKNLTVKHKLQSQLKKERTAL